MRGVQRGKQRRTWTLLSVAARKNTKLPVQSLINWSEFLVAAAGASAALVGLVFVALSINLARIIELPGVSGRAAETIILLAGVLAGSLSLLIPDLSSTQHGMALLVTAVPTWAVPMQLQFKLVSNGHYHRLWQACVRVLLHQAATLPGILSGLALCGWLPGGIFWFAIGAIVSILTAMFSAWILLVEIVR